MAWSIWSAFTATLRRCHAKLPRNAWKTICRPCSPSTSKIMRKVRKVWKWWIFRPKKTLSLGAFWLVRMPAYASTTTWRRSQSRAVQIGPWGQNGASSAAPSIQMQLHTWTHALSALPQPQASFPPLMGRHWHHLASAPSDHQHPFPTTSPRLIIIYAFGRLGQLMRYAWKTMGNQQTQDLSVNISHCHCNLLGKVE